MMSVAGVSFVPCTLCVDGPNTYYYISSQATGSINDSACGYTVSLGASGFPSTPCTVNYQEWCDSMCDGSMAGPSCGPGPVTSLVTSGAFQMSCNILTGGTADYGGSLDGIFFSAFHGAATSGNIATFLATGSMTLANLNSISSPANCAAEFAPGSTAVIGTGGTMTITSVGSC
jgi:hypothetical protein